MISIIVPVYKVKKYLPQCLDSLLDQTYKDIEILLIDDGSSDGGSAVCDTYAKKDSRVRVIHTKHDGVSAARNTGLDHAHGEYIGFVDSDDWVEPEMYQVLLEDMLAHGAGISVCSLIYEYRDRQAPSSRIVDKVYSSNEAIEALIHKTIGNFVWNKLYRKELFEGVRFPVGQTYEDVATVYKLVFKTDTVVSTSRALYHYRKRGGSIVRTPSMNNLESRFRSYKDRYEDLVRMPQFRDPELVFVMEKQVADAIGKAWRWALKVPKEKRNMDVYKEMSAFARSHYPVFGDRRWHAYLRISMFFARSTSAFSFAVVRAMTAVYSALFIRGRG